MTQATTHTGTPDLRSHFGFSVVPFTREIDIDQRWTSEVIENTIADLEAAAQQRQIAVLIAPSGCGKTLVLRALRHQLPEARYRVHDIKVTSLSKRDFCREIATATGARTAGTYPALVRSLQDHFLALTDQEALRCVLLIDEAQDMRPEVLAILRILTNFEMDSRLVLSIVLAGDHRLRHLLDHPDLLPIARRVSHFATLRPLSRTETTEYMKHRIRIAGKKDLPFDNQATEAICEITRGNLRAIDYLARKSLQLAARQRLAIVDTNVVTEARKLILI